MNFEEYRKAYAKAKRCFRASVSKGEYPYLQVLDEILENTDVVTSEELGVVDIPAGQIVGTKTSGRRSAFANNFMPLLDEETEFANKWQVLCDAHMNEGIREPILAYEFLNKFYVQEGNKRVSVLKFFEAACIPGRVIRLVPRRTDTKENRIYYEFMDFYRVTGLNCLYFSELGCFAKLLQATGKGADEKWNEEERSLFNSVYLRFTEALRARGGDQMPITGGDALLRYLGVYGYEEAQRKSVAEFKADLEKMWLEIVALTEDSAVEISLSSTDVAKTSQPSLLSKLFAPQVTTLKVGFLHEKNAEDSAWTYAHEFGRHQLEDAFPNRVQTVCYDNLQAGVDDEEKIEQAIAEGCQVIFTTTPKLKDASLRAAIRHPDVKVLNCSINVPHPNIRTYYGRIHEAKFLVGAIAGALAADDKIGYVATYPTYGMTAGINAFALGVRLANPRAKVYLKWTAVKGADVDREFAEMGVRMISSQDMRNPRSDSKKYGLYRVLEDGSYQDIAMPLWHWGEFYAKIIRSILDGGWENEVSGNQARAVNYWWGMTAGVIDVLYSRSLPQGTRRMVELLRRAMSFSDEHTFTGPLYDQQGALRVEEGKFPSPEQVIQMDWLVDNVVGGIPTMDELIEEAKPLVRIQGVNKGDIAPSIL